jgi:hypothetical protein
VTFSGNLASRVGGGMANVGSDPTLTNVTFSGNTATRMGGGMYNSSDSNPTIANSIFWGNSDGVLIADGGSSSTTISYSDIEGGWTGTGNINVDPLFVDDPDPGNDDYRDLQLQVGSPAIDAGDNSFVSILIDLAGNPRIVNGTVDMGAYENQENQGNDPPVADPNGPYLGAVYSTITFDGTGSSDPDNDTLTYVWTFGDGNTGTGSTTTHSYAYAEIYDVCLTVNDGTVESGEVCTIVVIYDPDSGFVTGGGWISSPTGAYIADPSLSGKATFGFVSKYKKGASIPTGNTEFQFKAGDFNFHSSSYEWLVVTGSDYAKFKGTGTINGEGEYKFKLLAGDNDPDTFRIKIWEEDEFGTETVISDNGTDQAIAGGNIVIHTKK